jgi:hypothetical protein
MKGSVLAALAAIAFGIAALPARAADDCPAPEVTVTGATKAGVPPLPANATPEQKSASVVQLGDTIELTITGLDRLIKDIECRQAKALPKRTPILFLAAQPIKGLTGYLPGPPGEGKIRFDLAHSTGSKTAWALVLANPWITDAPLDVSMGFEDSYPFKSSAQIPFRKLAVFYGLAGAIFMLVLLALFVGLLLCTDMCRDGRPAIPSDIVGAGAISRGAYGPYSLSKVQAGIWFLVILGAYILIVAVTHDLSGTVNATALTLMGIGAATMVGSTVIQTNQSDVAVAAAAAAQANAARELAKRMQDLQASLKGKEETSEGAAIKKSLEELGIAFKRATNQSIGLWKDIISDANGVNFHRFQMTAWTVVLASIFAIAVWRVLAMPDFDNTLLALQGLSAGTYLGLKVNESKVTTVPDKPKPTETP